MRCRQPNFTQSGDERFQASDPTSWKCTEHRRHLRDRSVRRQQTARGPPKQRVAALSRRCSGEGATATTEVAVYSRVWLKLPIHNLLISFRCHGDIQVLVRPSDTAARCKAISSRLLERGGGSVTVGSTQYTQVSTIQVSDPEYSRKKGVGPKRRFSLDWG